MTSPVNLRSEQVLREFEFERAIQDGAAADTPVDPEQHDNSGHGAPVAYLLLGLALGVMAACLGLLMCEYLDAVGLR